MTTCPKCAVALKDDYGMVTCPSCRSILFIDMDGMAHVGTEAEKEPDPPRLKSEPPTDIPVSAPKQEAPKFFDMTFNEMTPDLLAPPLDISAEPPWAPDAGTSGEAVHMLAPDPPFPEPDAVSEAEIEASREAPHSGAGQAAAEEEAPLDMDALLGYQSGGDQAADQGGFGGAYGESVELGMPGDPLGLNSFANSEVSQAKDGLLSFRILVLGIDSKEIRESLREALEDARFAWDTEQIMGLITKGQLILEHVAPVKAMILINRIKRLPIEIRWEQYAITQREGN